MRRRFHRPVAQAGFGLIESLVSISIIAVTLTAFGGVLSTVGAFKRNDFRFQAANFVREEIDALHALPYSELIDQTNGHFLGLAFTRGAWQVRNEVTAPSAGRVIELTEASEPALVQETGMLIEPTNYHDNFAFTAKLRTLATSPAGWGTAIAFRYRDASNHYRFRLTAGGFALDRVQHGVITTVWSQNTTINTGTWYTLSIVCDGSTIKLWNGGTLLVTKVDSSFATGDIAIMSLNGSLLQADDVAVSQGGEIGSWNFNADPVGAIPLDWQRFVYFDLPGGQGALTIADYHGRVGMKQVTVTVTWNHLNVPQSITGTTIIANSD
jgi:prepilin-type N-terminal cleavage/methylation domain-containing protein